VAPLRIGVIGGSGLEDLFDEFAAKKYSTPYGKIDIYLGSVEGVEVLYIPRHGPGHRYPPHKVRYKANIYASKRLGVEWLIATSAVGSLKKELRPGYLVIPNDIIDYTRRSETFYDEQVVHVDFTHPYCLTISDILFKSAYESQVDVRKDAVYICTEGPRFETPSEIRMFRDWGADIVGMTNIPECVLARELAIHYALLTVVTNYAAGIQDRISHEEVYSVMREAKKHVLRILHKSIVKLDKIRDVIDDCVFYKEEAEKLLHG
jgi:5'-methylthioadenosine phosphorylase